MQNKCNQEILWKVRGGFTVMDNDKLIFKYLEDRCKKSYGKKKF